MNAVESALLVSAAALLMVQAGLAKRRLAWRRPKTKCERRRQP